MSGPTGIELTESEHAALLDALHAVGLDTSSDVTWDSLDVACVLAVLEHSLAIVLDPATAHPRMLRSVAALRSAIAEHGTRRSPAARMRLDVAASDDPTASERDRRRLEYRLSLARPDLRAAVARRGSLSVLANADSPMDLPVTDDALAALGVSTSSVDTATSTLHPVPAVDTARDSAAGQMVELIEASIRGFVEAHTGQLWAPANSVIAVEELRRLGYYDAHPEQVIHLGAETALLPAACLGAFRALPHEPVLATFFATVFRRESFYEAASGRLPTYTCRELLWHASPEQETAMADEVADLLSTLAQDLDLRWRWSEASDPFFLASGEHGGKRELRAKSAVGEIAIASVNAHGGHFTSRGNGRSGWHTGCAGLGLERWALVAGASL